MMSYVKAKYYNFTIEMEMVYLSTCKPCQQNQSDPRKYLVVNRIKCVKLASTYQVDNTDMQSQGDGDFIMVYHDHVTKFIYVRALKIK